MLALRIFVLDLLPKGKERVFDLCPNIGRELPVDILGRTQATVSKAKLHAFTIDPLPTTGKRYGRVPTVLNIGLWERRAMHRLALPVRATLGKHKRARIPGCFGLRRSACVFGLINDSEIPA